MNNDLEKILISNIEEAKGNNLEEIELKIPRDIYFNIFGGMFTELQDSLKVLCSRYGLEMSAKDKDRRIIYEDNTKNLMVRESQPIAIIVKLKRDYDNPNYQRKIEETKLLE